MPRQPLTSCRQPVCVFISPASLLKGIAAEAEASYRQNSGVRCLSSELMSILANHLPRTSLRTLRLMCMTFQLHRQNKFVYMDIEIGGEAAGRLVFEVWLSSSSPAIDCSRQGLLQKYTHLASLPPLLSSSLRKHFPAPPPTLLSFAPAATKVEKTLVGDACC